jgi:Flp pilus assembly protein TadD
MRATVKEQVLAAMDKGAAKLRETLGESLSSVQKFDTRIEEATTPSLEALKAYSLARRTQSEKGDVAAIPLLKRAIELDPNFAVAHANLGVSYANIGEAKLASESFQKAYELRSRVSERERFRVSAEYYTFVTGEMEKANQTYEQLVQAYPRDDEPPINLASNYSAMGQYEKAVMEALEGLRLSPDNGPAYADLACDYAYLNRLDEAKAANWTLSACTSVGMGLLSSKAIRRRCSAKWSGPQTSLERRMPFSPTSPTPRPFQGTWEKHGNSPGARSNPLVAAMRRRRPQSGR